MTTTSNLKRVLFLQDSSTSALSEERLTHSGGWGRVLGLSDEFFLSANTISRSVHEAKAINRYYCVSSSIIFFLVCERTDYNSGAVVDHDALQ